MRHLAALALLIISFGCVPPTVATSPSKTCPPPGTNVALTKAVSASFIKDYAGCSIVVDAVFYKMGNDGYILSKYDVKANTTFQVLEPGGSPTAQMGMSFGIFAGTPKSKSDILFQLRQGDPIQLHGAPIGYSLMGTAMATVFHAELVTRK